MRFVMGSVLVAAFAVLSVPAFVSAQEQGGSFNYKVGVVDRKKVFDSYVEQKPEYKSLLAEKEQMQVQLDALQKKIEGEQDRLEKGRDTMEETAAETLEQELQSDVLMYQTEFKRMQTEIDSKFNRLVKNIKEEIDNVVADIAQKDGYDLILEGDPRSGSGVLYFATSIEITSRVSAQLATKQ